jgi:restriction system protein
MAKYEQILTNKATGERALVKSNDPYLLEQKIERQVAKWQREADKRHATNLKAEKSDDAAQQTQEAKERIVSYGKILAATLSKNDRIDWNELKSNAEFHAYKPDPAPVKEDFFTSVPKKSFFEVIFTFLRKSREQAEAAALGGYEMACKKYAGQEEKNRKDYEDARTLFQKKQRDHNEKVETLRGSFEQGSKDAIEGYLNMVLERSEYPDDVSLDHDISFDKSARLLRIDTQLPAFDDISFVSEVKYVASKDTFQTKYLGKTEAKSIYTAMLYQIAIRTLHEIFEAEYTGHVHFIEFNGFVSGIDPKRGNEVKTSVLKLKADRDTFMQINLARVDAEACASGFGGKLEKIAFDLSSIKKSA